MLLFKIVMCFVSGNKEISGGDKRYTDVIIDEVPIFLFFKAYML